MAVPQFFDLVFWLIYVAAFFTSLYALIECIRTPADAFLAVDKQTKKLWLILLGSSAFLSLATVFGTLPLRFLAIAALIVAIIFLVDVRPAVRNLGKPGEGPYGPW